MPERSSIEGQPGASEKQPRSRDNEAVKRALGAAAIKATTSK